MEVCVAVAVLVGRGLGVHVAEAVGASPVMVAVPPPSAVAVLVGTASGVISADGAMVVDVGVKVETIPLVGTGEAIPGTNGDA